MDKNLQVKLNEAIEAENVQQADALTNQISELMHIEINTEMPEGFTEQIKNRFRRDRGNKLKHFMKVAGIILIAAVGFTVTTYATTDGKLSDGIKITADDQYNGQDTWIRINGREVDPENFKTEDGSICINNSVGMVETGMGPEPVTLSPGINLVIQII